MTEQTKTDWRTLPAGEELDKVVAAYLGYDNFHTSGATGLLWGWHDIRPDDPPHHVENGRVRDPLPNYSTDLNAAFALPVEGLYYLDLHGPNEEDQIFRAFIQEQYSDEHDECIGRRGEADTPALAVVRAWLSWKAGRR